MAITYTDNGGGAPNGSDLEFTFTFPVIQTEDVKVSLNGVTQLTTKYAVDTASNPTKITFNNTSIDSSVQESSGAPKSGVRVNVYRETTVGKASGDDDPKAVFAAGSSIRATDLNANSEQALYAIHELQDRPIETEDIQADSITNALIADDQIDSEHYVDGSIDTQHIGDDQVTMAKLGSGALPTDITVADANIVTGTLDNRYYTETELNNGQLDNRYYTETELDAGQLDNRYFTETELTNGSLDGRYFTETELTNGALDGRYFTETESDARYFNISSGETIKDGDTFPDNDTTIATTAAINDRIIDLVDDVGGFVPIANETSFPASNPDVNNAAGTIVSVSAASTNLTPSGTTVTITNGAGTGNNVTITGVPTTIPSGFGFLVETTTNTHTYTFHRLSPKATEVTTVAGKATEIGLLGTADVVEDLSILGTADVVADLAILGTNDVVADLNTLGTADVVADLNTLATADVVNDMNILGTSANVTAMDNCSGSIASINNASSNLNSINNFGDTYQVASSNPSTDGGGNALAEGDLYFNTTANELKVYNGGAWQGGVTASGNFAATTGNTFTGDNRYNDNAKALFGTGSDLEIYHSGSHSYIEDIGTGNLNIVSNRFQVLNQGKTQHIAKFIENAAVELYYDNSKKFETTSTGIKVTGTTNTGSVFLGDFRVKGTDDSNFVTFKPAENLVRWHDNDKATFGDDNDLQIYHDGSHSYIDESGTGNLYIRNGTKNSIWCKTDGEVKLYYDDSAKLETTSTGATVTGSLVATSNIEAQGAFKLGNGNYAIFGASNGMFIYHTGNTGIIDNNVGTLKILSDSILLRNDAEDHDYIKCTNGGSVDLYYDNVKTFETTSDGIDVQGQIHALGTVPQLRLNTDTSDGSTTRAMLGMASSANNFVNGAEVNDVVLNCPKDFIISHGANELMAQFKDDSSVELYCDHSKKFNTDANGVQITGRLSATTNISAGTYLYSGGQVYSDDFITATLHNSSILQLKSRNALGTEQTLLKGTNGGAVELYHNGTKKFETDSGGVTLFDDLFVTDNNIIYCGDGLDLLLMSDGSTSFIRADDLRIRSQNNLEDLITCAKDGAIKLYYDNAPKFETRTDGVIAYNKLWIENTNLNLSQSSQALKITNTYGYTQIGPLNSSYSHFYTDRPDYYFNTNIVMDGNLTPYSNGSYSLGSSSARWANIYSMDLHLSNEGSSNDMDGTWGDWTIQEGESDLFLKNNRSGKKFKFNLTEVS